MTTWENDQKEDALKYEGDLNYEDNLKFENNFKKRKPSQIYQTKPTKQNLKKQTYQTKSWIFVCWYPGKLVTRISGYF